MIAQTQTSVNVLSQTPTNYSSLKREWRSLAHQLIKQHKLKNNAKAILLEMVNSSDRNGEGFYGREHIAEKTNTSVSTVGRVYKLFRSLKIIESIERRGWNQNVAAKDRTNITRLLFTETKLPAVEVKMTYDIINPDLTLRDLTNNIHYEEYVCISDNLEREKKTNPPKASLGRDSTKHISNAKLQTEPETEIKRAVQAYGVAETEVAEIVRVMGQKRNLPNPARYLVGILRNKLKDNPSSITYKPETEQERLNRYAKERGCLPPDHESSPPSTHIKELLAKFKRISNIN